MGGSRSHSEFFLENHPKIALNHNALLKVVSYYDLSVLSMSVMGSQKKFGWGMGEWGKLYPSLFGIFFNFAKSLTGYL